ncbi:hypothetical protein K3H43_14615 [Aeromonas veronii]|uniref:hypothetical protein n=1 Tax=Aeromonas TaxID=642 RepID=UPI001F43D726|nr:hypothetical protein [Aeromonas veronii]MCF5728605.1 hypothetical protein [Aeromonas veronii]
MGDGICSAIIQHYKLIGGLLPGTNLITDLVNEEDLLSIANHIAYQKRAKGNLRLGPMPNPALLNITHEIETKKPSRKNTMKT